MNRHHSLPILLSLFAAASLSACSGHDASVADQANLDKVAQIVARHNDRISADELARWIIQGKNDFVLIDVRSADDFTRGHIKGAVNHTVPELVAQKQLESLPTDRKIILYSQGSETAAQAATLLRLKGFDADILLGGYNFWAKHVLNPTTSPTLADDEYPDAAAQQAVACYFIGGPATTQGPPPKQVPVFVPPTTPAAPHGTSSHEGC